MYCSHCGAEIREGARFCENCGSPVDEKAGKAGASSGKKKALIAGILAAVVLAAGIGVMVGHQTSGNPAAADGGSKAQAEEPTNAAAGIPEDYYDPDEYDFTAVTQGGLSQREMENVLDVVTAYTEVKEKRIIGEKELNEAGEESAIVIAHDVGSLRTEDTEDSMFAVFPMDETNRLLSFCTNFRYEPNSTYQNGYIFTNDDEVWITMGIGWMQDARITSVYSSEEEIGVDYHTEEYIGEDTPHNTYYHATLRPNDQGRFYLHSIELVADE